MIDLKILTKSDDKQDGLAADVAILDSSESTPSDLAADKRLRYLIAPSHGTLHFVDTRNPETKDIADEKAAVLTLLPEAPQTIWLAGTDGQAINALTEILANNYSFPAQLSSEAEAGRVVQVVWRAENLPHLDIYTSP